MRIADVLPLTPLQQGLLFHAITAQSDRDDVYAVQLNITLSGPLDSDRLGEAVQAVVTRHPNLVARFSQKFAEPMQIIPADPVAPWQYVDLTGDTDNLDAQIERVCIAERSAVCDLAEGPAFRAAVIRTAPDQHLLVMTNHHIVLDGWSLPILLGEVFASYYGQRLPPVVPYRRFVSWLSGRDLDAAREASKRRPWWARPAARARADARSLHLRCPRRSLAHSASWHEHVIPPSARCCRAPSLSC